jgi:hypothetical protein
VRDGASEEAHGRWGLLVGEYLDVRQSCCVVDRDVDVLPANRLAVNAGCVTLASVVVLVAGDAGFALVVGLLSGLLEGIWPAVSAFEKWDKCRR